MKNKLVLSILTVSILSAIIVAAIALTNAWFIAKTETNFYYQIPARGYLVIYFDSITQEGDQLLKPAVAQKNAVRDHIDMQSYDPLTVSEYVAEPATVVTYKAVAILNNAVEDSWAEPIELKLSYVAKVMNMAGTDYFNLSLERDIVISVDIAVIYGDGTRETFDDLVHNSIFSVTANCRVEITLQAHLFQLDELCDPAVRLNNIVIALGITALE